MTKSDALGRPVKIVGAMLDDLKKHEKICVFCSFMNSFALLTLPLLLPFCIIWLSA